MQLFDPTLEKVRETTKLSTNTFFLFPFKIETFFREFQNADLNMLREIKKIGNGNEGLTLFDAGDIKNALFIFSQLSRTFFSFFATFFIFLSALQLNECDANSQMF